MIIDSDGSVLCDSRGTIHKRGRKFSKKQAASAKDKNKRLSILAKKNISKKKILLFSSIFGLSLVFVFLISSHTICINHKWLDANCLEPQTCWRCGKTQGEPNELVEIEWPSKGLASLLPAPKSNLGEPRRDSSEYFCICVGKYSINDFNTYVKECSAAGFDVDYNMSEGFYFAYNEYGNNIRITYEGNDIMMIQIWKS